MVAEKRESLAGSGTAGFASTKKPRILFLDLLRGLAMVVMIEVHMVNSLLNPAYRGSSWFPVLDFVNGLVAPTFLFVSGAVFAFVSERKRPSFLNFGPEFWKQVTRIVFILFLGYTLRLPYFSWRNLSRARPERLAQLWRVDVLQCIAVGLTLLFLLCLLLRSGRNYRRALAVLGFMTLLISPWAWSVNGPYLLPLPLAGYLNPQRGSLFHLFPWMAFMFFGGLFGALLGEARREEREEEFFKRLLILSGGLILVGGLFMRPFLNPQPLFAPSRPNYFFFLLRLGLVLLLAASCWLFERKRGLNSRSLLMAASAESLTVYYFHIQLMNRKLLMGRSLVSRMKHTTPPLTLALLTLLLIGIMLLWAFLWNRYKERDPRRALLTARGVMVMAALVFFFG